MDNINKLIAVQKMQEFIERNIYEYISLKKLSSVTEYSPWYASKIFKNVTGKSPFDYIRAMRLTKAALSLRDENLKVIDVALDFVFDSHEGFTKAFSKEFGISPKEYKKHCPPIQLFMPEKFFDTYNILNKGIKKMETIDFTKTIKTIFVQIIERPKRKALIKRASTAKEYFKYCEEVGCEVWAMLSSVKEALYEPSGMWLPKNKIKKGTSEYVLGVELPLDYNKTIPEGYELIEFQECMMMIFQGEPYNDDNFMEEIRYIQKHIKNFNPAIYGYKFDYESSPSFQLSPEGYRGYIEAHPVTLIKK